MPGARHYDLRPVRNRATVTRCSCFTGSGDVERYACRFGNLHSPPNGAVLETVSVPSGLGQLVGGIVQDM